MSRYADSPMFFKVSECSDMKKQVEESHYAFDKYVSKRRWASMWHQLDEVTRLNPKKVLEIGPGPGLFKATAQALGLHVETLDIDPELNPDHVASVFEMPFGNSSYDVVCAFQMLEHLPWDDSKRAFREMARVATVGLVISLPDAATRWPISVHVPKIGKVNMLIPKPSIGPRDHEFDGQHYWEINKAGYPLRKIQNELFSFPGLSLEKSYRVPENPYHRFFVLSKT